MLRLLWSFKLLQHNSRHASLTLPSPSALITLPSPLSPLFDTLCNFYLIGCCNCRRAVEFIRFAYRGRRQVAFLSKLWATFTLSCLLSYSLPSLSLSSALVTSLFRCVQLKLSTKVTQKSDKLPRQSRQMYSKRESKVFCLLLGLQGAKLSACEQKLISLLPVHIYQITRQQFSSFGHTQMNKINFKLHFPVWGQFHISFAFFLLFYVL